MADYWDIDPIYVSYIKLIQYSVEFIMKKDVQQFNENE
jgi:hypothetical protein